MNFYTQRLGFIKTAGLYLPEVLSAKLFRQHGLLDLSQNSFALYKHDYLVLKAWVQEHYPDKKLFSLTRREFIQALNQSRVRVIRYLTASSLADFLFDIEHFNTFDKVKTTQGVQGLEEGRQNCLVHCGEKLYLCPKVRAQPDVLSVDVREEKAYLKVGGKGVFGIAHTSFTQGASLKFAGNLVHDGRGWIIDNSSGHYETRATQMRGVLNHLVSLGMDISKLRVCLYIPKNPKKLNLLDEDFDSYIEAADTFLNRTNSAIANLSLCKS